MCVCVVVPSVLGQPTPFGVSWTDASAGVESHRKVNTRVFFFSPFFCSACLRFYRQEAGFGHHLPSSYISSQTLFSI